MRESWSSQGHRQRTRALASRDQIEEPLNRALATLISPRTGVITAVHDTSNGLCDDWGVWLCFAEMTAPNDHVRRTSMWTDWCGGTGVGLDRYSALIAAVGEAVERYAACTYDPDQDMIWASYEDVQGAAISPDEFVLLSAREYEQWKHIVTPFQAQRPIGWAKGRHFTDGSLALVPASFVYGDYRYSSFDEVLTPVVVSTGLAAGPSWEQAVLSGLCECVERDAFMITYLNRLPVPEIDLDQVTHPKVRDLLDRIPPWAYTSIRAWNLTTDIGIPTVLAMIMGDGETTPAFLCGASANVDRGQALYKALIEAVQCYGWATRYLVPKYKDHVWAEDFSDVLTRDDQMGLAAKSGFAVHLEWLLESRPKTPLESLPDLRTSSVVEALAVAADAVQQVGLPIVTVDLTQPDIASAGFHATRVLIPGTQPLTFGPVRLLGGRRLYEAPYRLGYTSEPTTEESLNPVPHPFP